MEQLPAFSQRVLTWFTQYGRKDLPWQQHSTPYRVWVSEIMLQQTQVNTVIPYYLRFLQRFPDVYVLAQASLDEVLHHWTGLGYYARARHLHQAAQQICSHFSGQLSTEFNELLNLPGIGRSTAGAILALAHGQRRAILDGNVKRLLCRYHALAGYPGESQVARQLWTLAEYHLPEQEMPAYTQAIMDLGATVCTRSKSRCEQCPVSDDCLAHQQGQEQCYPHLKPRSQNLVRTITFVMLQNPLGEVLLEQRPLRGVWGGLWSFPECATPTDVLTWCQENLDISEVTCHSWPIIRHTFTHFHLDITPVHISVTTEIYQNRTLPNKLWYNVSQPQVCGLAAPVARLLAQIVQSNLTESLLL